MNKKELKFEQTDKKIISSYEELRKQKKYITIDMICKKARINKSTFYSHFKGKKSLHNELCNRLIDKIFNNKSMIENINSPKEFLNSFINSIKDNKDDSYGFDNFEEFASYLEKRLLKKYANIENLELKYAITFSIGGICRLISNFENKIDLETILSSIEKSM